MRAMVLHEIGPIKDASLSLVDLPKPEPGDGEIRIQVQYCGVCRTDLHVIEGDLPPQKTPIVPGHQVVGIVEKLGPGCHIYREGDRVGIAWLASTCNQCRFCHKGQENLCESSCFTGYQVDGGYAEYTVAKEAYAYKIPEAFADEAAAPLLCAGIIGYRALKQVELKPKESLAIFGFGSSAHIVMQLAISRGCDIYVVTRGAKHRELAESMGATWVGASIVGMPKRVDRAIIFAPAGELVPQALEILEKGGKLATAGIHMSVIPSMDYTKHLFFEKSITSVTCNTRQDGGELLREAAKIPIRPQVTTYPLEEANKALNDLKNDRVNGSAVLTISD